MTGDDGALLARTARGDHAAFESFVVRHQDAVWRFVRAATRTSHDAEDALQETFLAAYRAAGQFRGESAARTWLFSIARHAALRGRRRAVEEVGLDEDLWALGCEAGWGEADPNEARGNPERTLLAEERAARLERALACLDPEDREIIVLRDLEELPGEEVAGILGLTLAATKSRVHRARLRLAVAVRREERR